MRSTHGGDEVEGLGRVARLSARAARPEDGNRKVVSAGRVVFSSKHRAMIGLRLPSTTTPRGVLLSAAMWAEDESCAQAHVLCRQRMDGWGRRPIDTLTCIGI